MLVKCFEPWNNTELKQVWFYLGKHSTISWYLETAIYIDRTKPRVSNDGRNYKEYYFNGTDGNVQLL